MELDYTGFRPQAVDEPAPALSLDRLLCSRITFFARMRGNAMSAAGVRHGDLLVIEPAEHYRDGTLVLALVGRQTLVRRLERTPIGFQLSASNPKYPTLELGEDCVIRGRIVASITPIAAPRVPLPVVS
jgi:DNA polymerase V